MKKKIYIFLGVFVFLLLSSCFFNNNENNSTSGDTDNLQSCNTPYTIGTSGGQILDLKAKVVSENIKNILSTNGGNIEYLDCEKGKKVTAGTLIAKIKPDYTDPNIQNLVNQSNMINSQIANTENIITSTKDNFSTQFNSLNTQKSNLETQLSILNDSYSKINEQKDFGVSDIDNQLNSLQNQLNSVNTQLTKLNDLKVKLQNSKTADVEKLNLSLKNTRTQIKSLISNVLLQFDEIFGITDKNKDKNDSFEMYLSAKNVSLKNNVIAQWHSINDKDKIFDTLSNDEIASLLQDIDSMAVDAKDVMKNSVSSSSFTETTINNYYSLFMQFESGSLSAKGGIETISKSIETVSNSYDSQLLNLDIQISSAENNRENLVTNIANIKSNKLGTYTTSVDLQKNQTQSQIETLKTNLTNLSSQIESLKSQEQIQLNQLNNQISQLKASLNTININLNPQEIYAGVDGTIKEKSSSVSNKVGSNTLLCQILPNESSLKLQVYSSYNLSLPIDITFDFGNKTYTTKIINQLPYQDSVTQNYIYETSDSIFESGNPVNITDIVQEGKILDVKTVSKNKVDTGNKIYVPLDYVSNTISNSVVKLKSKTGEITKQVITLGELKSNYVEIRNGLNLGDTICK
ncbi:MAG: hypothetical protein PHN31_01250 [Candidatus Gracilibacteria bacterium]|nr:hypothetical protein [Candidatus Gracilibacteria bacterium]